MAEPPLLEIRDLVKQFDGHTVLDGVNLVLQRGETVVVLGGSGSGKSTLARIVMGLERPTSGHILLEGRDLVALDESELDAARNHFAMVFQKYALLDSLSVYDNVAFALKERMRAPTKEIHQRVMAMLDALGIAAAADKLPEALSGGMAKRVGIARAMVTAPDILIYDEPTSGLDPVTSRVVDDLIEEVRERFCVSSLVITHDMVTAYGISDRVVLLYDGKIAVDGPAREVFTIADPRIAPFAASSGVDPSRLVHPRRKSPEAIRAIWRDRHRA